MTATRVEADPIGVMLPPRFAPKITAHHNGPVGGRAKPSAIGIPSMIFASMAASGILSVTALNTAVATMTAPVPTVGPSAIIRSRPMPINEST